MRRLLMIILFSTLSMSSYANIAVDEINQTLAHQQVLKTRQAQQSRLGEALKPYSFVLFYRSTCPHCHKFVPILKDFAETYHIKIEAYATDGQSLDGLQGQPMTAKEYQDYFLDAGVKPVVPALYLKNNDTDQVYPVLFGEAQPYQLANRMATLLMHIQAQLKQNKE